MELEMLRQFCLSLPCVTEDIKWESRLVFSIGGKMFCMADLEEPFKRAFKVKDEDFEELCQREGFMAAPHLARAKWIAVLPPYPASRKELETLVHTSYELVKAKLPRKPSWHWVFHEAGQVLELCPDFKFNLSVFHLSLRPVYS